MEEEGLKAFMKTKRFYGLIVLSALLVIADESVIQTNNLLVKECQQRRRKKNMAVKKLWK